MENHSAKTLVECDSSRFTSNSFRIADDQRIDRSVTLVKSHLDVQEAQLSESLNVPSQCSANSACVGSSSGDLMLEMLENTTSELNPISNDLFLDATEESDEDGIWSILTDNLYYLRNSIPRDPGTIRYQNPDMSKLTHSAKKRFFNDDQNNKPEKKNVQFERQH